MRPVTQCLATLALSAVFAVPVLAQGQNDSAMSKWRDQHKYTFQLRTMLTNGIAECERSKSTEVKPAQAKSLLAVITPLRKQSKLSQDQAKAAILKVQRSMDARQLTAIDRAIQASARRGVGRPGGGGPGGAGGPGGGSGGAGAAGGGGDRPRFDPQRMKDFNPFNPDKSSPMYERAKKRNDELFTFLQARAAGKTAKLDLPEPGRR